MNDPRDRGYEFWQVTPEWRGETVFLLAGGPSLRGFAFDRLRGRRVIAINRAGYDAPFADILFFTDNSWFEANRKLVDAWPGRAVSLSRAAKKTAPDRILRPLIEHAPDFNVPPGTVRFGRSSGHTAICLAIALGARRIVLLGYDMQPVGGRSHYHDDYSNPDPKLFAEDMLPAFAGWGAQVQALGIDVINATPGSALKEFPMADLDTVLCAA